MRSISKLIAASVVLLGLLGITSCKDEEDQDCTGCGDDAPYSTLDGNSCYTTLNECESNESGNCVICQ